MVAHKLSQRGATLIEVTVSVTLTAVVVTGTLALMARSLRALRHTSKVQAVECERPLCSAESHSSSCSCGQLDSIILW